MVLVEVKGLLDDKAKVEIEAIAVLNRVTRVVCALMINPKSFLYEQSASGVATITLNRPERLNALTFEVYRELTDTFAAFRR